MEPAAGGSAATSVPEEPAWDPHSLIQSALSELNRRDPARGAALMEELAYLANVLVAGAEGEFGALTPSQAASAALASVFLGALLEAGSEAPDELETQRLTSLLQEFHADILFRRAAVALAGSSLGHLGQPFLAELSAVPATLRRLHS